MSLSSSGRSAAHLVPALVAVLIAACGSSKSSETHGDSGVGGGGGGDGGTGVVLGGVGEAGSGASPGDGLSAADAGATGLCGPSTTGNYGLSADRATTWNLAGLLTKGGVPSAMWPICNATPLKPSGGDDTAPINAQIGKCAAGSVVMLGPGTFIENTGNFVLVNKGVVLRGSGAGATILNRPANKPTTMSDDIEAATDPTPSIIIGPAQYVNPDGDARCNGLTAFQPAYMQMLSADGAKGSMSVTVASGSIFKAGGFVLLDETSNAGWQPDVAQLSTSVWASPTYDIEYQLHKPAVSDLDDPVALGVTPSMANNYAGAGNGSDAACYFLRQDRPHNEMKEIASVSGNTVTFTSPLHRDYHMSQYAELTTFTGGNVPLQNAGVEDLTTVGGGDGSIRFQNAAYCWAKNVEVTQWYGEGVSLQDSFRDELRDSYIHDASWPEPGGAGYAISISNGSAELLIENNISIRANKVMVARSSGSGSVVGYNYMDDGYIATDENWVEIGLNASHMVGSHHVLFEGNQSFDMDSDDTHGNSTYHTYFRNWSTTVRTKFTSDYTGNTIDDVTTPMNGPKRAAGAMIYSYSMSFVGNVLGEQNVSTTANGYVDSDPNFGDDKLGMIWFLGWNGNVPYTTDTNVAKTAVQDGNWDWLLGQQTWLTGTAAPLPDSCYLPGKPAFFGSNTWPWVDPTTGMTYTLPAQARFAAGTPNTVP
jgi:hypothetical protein